MMMLLPSCVWWPLLCVALLEFTLDNDVIWILLFYLINKSVQLHPTSLIAIT